MITSDDNILVGLSGGADSCALLYSLKSLSKDIKGIASHNVITPD